MEERKNDHRVEWFDSFGRAVGMCAGEGAEKRSIDGPKCVVRRNSDVRVNCAFKSNDEFSKLTRNICRLHNAQLCHVVDEESASNCFRIQTLTSLCVCVCVRVCECVIATASAFGRHSYFVSLYSACCFCTAAGPHYIRLFRRAFFLLLFTICVKSSPESNKNSIKKCFPIN